MLVNLLKSFKNRKTLLWSSKNSLKFCVRTMVLARKVKKNLLIPQENYIRRPKINRIVVHGYATRSQISKTLYKTNTRIGFEENPIKKPFGIPSTKIFQEKNHFCASFDNDPFVCFTSSKGKNGIAGVSHEIVAPGPIFQKKNSTKNFVLKPQMIYKTSLKTNCVVRTKYTAAECKKIYIKNFQIALRTKQIKRTHPEFYQEHQKLFKEFMNYKIKSHKEKYDTLCYLFREFLKDAKKLDDALLD